MVKEWRYEKERIDWFYLNNKNKKNLNMRKKAIINIYNEYIK